MVAKEAKKPAGANELTRRSFFKVLATRMIKKEAFTSIALLVVIAILALLPAILMPALHAIRMQATGVVCMANLNGISKSRWLDGAIIANADGESSAPSQGRDPAWLSAHYIPGRKHLIRHTQRQLGDLL